MKYRHNAFRQMRLLLRHIRYGRLFTFGRQAQVRRRNLEILYRTTNRFLRDLDVDHWLVHGTLLGYYRNGSLLEGDTDIDIGVSERDFAKIWQSRGQLPSGYKLYDTSFNHYGPKLYVSHDGWEVDIYFFGEAEGQLHPYEKDPKAGYEQPFPKSLVYPLQAALFLGETTRIPHQTEALLIHTYGYIGEDAVQDRATGYWRQREHRESA